MRPRRKSRFGRVPVFDILETRQFLGINVNQNYFAINAYSLSKKSYIRSSTDTVVITCSNFKSTAISENECKSKLFCNKCVQPLSLEKKQVYLVEYRYAVRY